ncbi:Uncharacterized protein SCF082_LOCUS38399 [Durusdinium trenchii]|uniref:Alpha 1,4-glycosyltransferase domain-containing protein n=1 Tax=Durusdinium trenchii TaxID=1381693 RepID=A0ABP0Q0N3_9DINO
MLRTLVALLASGAWSYKLSLVPNEVSRQALSSAGVLQEVSFLEGDEATPSSTLRPTMAPGVVSNFQSILERLSQAVEAISGPAVKDPAPWSIPRRLLFNHKVNLLKAADSSLDKESKLLRENVRHTVKLFPDVAPSDVHFWDDHECQSGIEQLPLEESEALGLDFAREKVGMIKSDLCRLVMMYKLGGYYFDTDILPLPNLEQHLERQATFATVIADDGKSYFQAFLAATPKHPVILESLKEFKRWYDQLNRPGINQDRLRSRTAKGNIGTALMRQAFRKWSDGAKEDSVVKHPAGHLSQFFVEHNDRVLTQKRYEGVPSHLSGNLCNYAVVDRRSKTVVMFSRIYDKHSKTLCKEEVDFIHTM